LYAGKWDQKLPRGIMEALAITAYDFASEKRIPKQAAQIATGSEHDEGNALRHCAFRRNRDQNWIRFSPLESTTHKIYSFMLTIDSKWVTLSEFLISDRLQGS
jgi:hypothetical protein